MALPFNKVTVFQRSPFLKKFLKHKSTFLQSLVFSDEISFALVSYLSFFY